MARFHFDGEAVVLHLAHDDIALFRSLVEQLVELVSDGTPESAAAPGSGAGDPEADSFALWEADLSESPDEPEVPEDPALQRLFPNPYPHDPQAASDYRRFSAGDQKRRKLTDAETVRAALASGEPPVRIPVADVPAWLKTLNALRLVIASRLGIDDSEAMEDLAQIPDDDPRAMGAYLLDMLGELQAIIIELSSPRD
ncbi:DUF2017 family protein [Mariniluteicoccus flavus]